MCKPIVVIVLAMTMAACGDGGGGESSGQNPPPTPVDFAPAIQSVTLTPAGPKIGEAITATASVSDAEGNLKDALFKWFRNGVQITSATVLISGSSATPSSPLTGQTFAGGDQIKCEVTVSDTKNLSKTSSATATIAALPPVNAAPAIQSVTLTPASPRVGDIIIASASVSDPNGNLKEAVFKWFRNGVQIASATIPVTGASATPSSPLTGQTFLTDDQVRCEVTVSDTSNLSAVLSAAVTIIAPLAQYKPDYVCFSPYRPGQSPNARTRISEQQIREMLAVIAPYVKGIRIFGMNDGLENIPRIAKAEFGLDVIAGIWLDSNLEANEQGFNNLVASVKDGYVKVATIGNEVLLFGYINPTNAADNEAKLIDYIQRFKVATDGAVPVTTVDVYDEIISHPAVRAVCDRLFINIYPFWEGVAVESAVGRAYRSYLEVVDVAGGKAVVIAETGWPSAGNSLADAVPSPENAAAYFLNFVSMARAEGVMYAYFEAFDETWKTENTVGPHWGIWDILGAMKPGMIRVFNDDTVLDNWSCSAPIGGPGIPAIQLTAIPVYGNTDGIVRGTVSHVAPIDFKMTAYIDVGTVVNPAWWVKPYLATPDVPINCDGSFAIDTVTGGIDDLATEIRLYLIPADYDTPAVGFVAAPPAELVANAIAIISIRRGTDGSIQVVTLKP
jgi:exo-beta-1,3-glucanase (GH17 family)